MPYIKHERRARLESSIGALSTALKNLPGVKGDVNYAITEVVLRSLMPAGGWNYASLSDCISVLRDSADEIQRRMLGPYEDGAAERNGDCPSFQ